MSGYRSVKLGIEELRTFFIAVDRHLTSKRLVIIVIGGAAAALHQATTTTSDIDTYERIDGDLEQAIEQARGETGLDMPVGHATVAQMPWHFQDRVERRFPDLKRLELYVLEKHDLALSKCIRGNAHDEQQLREIHQSNPFDFDTLVDRFRTEMTHVTGNPISIQDNFLSLIEALFGELKSTAAKKRLEG